MPAAPTTLLLLPLDEQVAAFAARDLLGNLEPATARDGLVAPEPIAGTYAGWGRRFDPEAISGLVADDAPGRDTITTRDCTIQALVTIEDPENAEAGGAHTPRTIYCRGRAGSDAQRYSACVDIVADSTPGRWRMRWLWMDSLGLEKATEGALFAAPAGEIMLTWTRRWVSSDEVVCRFYINGELAEEVTSPVGDIAGATTGTTTIGVRCFDGASDFGYGWHGVIDGLKVTNYEMSAEEIRATWDRLARYQPAGVAAVYGNTPPGAVGWTDPSTRWGKLFWIAGQELGLAWSKVDELRENFLPDRAYQGDIERWERLLAIVPRATDSLDQRRDRVVAFMARDNGFSKEQIVDVLAEALAAAAEDLEVIEFSNRGRDDFEELSDEVWHHEPAGLWSAAGQLSATVSSGADMRWEQSVRNRYQCIRSLSTQERQNFVFGAEFAALGLTASSDGMVGLVITNWRTTETAWIGARFIGGVTTFGVMTFLGGVQTWTPLADAIGGYGAPAFPGAPCWLRVRRGLEDGGHPDRYYVGWSETSETEGYVEFEVNAMPTDPEWIGFGMLGLDGSTAGTNRIIAESFFFHEPRGVRPFCWYVLRDPILDGTPDLVLANALVQRIKPAHTHGAAIVSTSLLCDDEASGCDRGPMGVP